MCVDVFLGPNDRVTEAQALIQTKEEQQNPKTFWEWLRHPDTDVLGESATWYGKQPWYLEILLFIPFILCLLLLFISFIVAGILYCFIGYPFSKLYEIFIALAKKP
jgi:hypothetical protein